jgi:hypothetical protein
MAADGAQFDIDLLAASLRADLSDVGAFVEGLATKLQEALPGSVRIERARRGLMGPKAVRSISVEAEGGRLELVRTEREQVETVRARVSGGIVLKREPMEIEAWLDALGKTLAEAAERSERTRQALERLLLN